MTEPLQKYKEDFLLLIEAGFIAVKNADEEAATKLFKASELLNPKSQLPTVGYGYLHLCKLELRQASKMFQRVLEHEPNNDMAKAFLGICMSWTPDQMTDGEKLLHQTAKNADDPEIKTLANSALDFCEKYVKKAPSPAEMQAKGSKAKKTTKKKSS